MIIHPENRSYLKPFFKYLNQFHPLSTEFMDFHAKTCQIVHVKKNKFFLSPIDSNNATYFVLKGCVRGFIKDDNKDITTWFAFEEELIEAIRHPEQNSNYSMEYLQAIEDCDLVRIPFSTVDLLYLNFPEANILARKVLAQLYHKASERSILARIPTALGRYHRLESTDFNLNRIPQRFLASYLGMRLETLSRIRNKTAHEQIRKLA
ncbi:Crp/Fnr family transcriptional regulator [Pedobacter sp. MW01-1-1]|uniref:Crp/Fnr family transcriptional regulator n=1 Tax=Pedobacter sp. MW01-1-1 TaxID=3383027 RepID=UPI003FEF6895